MTTKPSEPQPADAPSQPPDANPTPKRLGTVVNRLARLALIVGIVWAGWYTWTIYSDLLHGPWPAPPPDPASAASVTMTEFDFGGSLPDDGPWLFAGRPWEIQTGFIAADEVDARLGKEPVGTPQGDRPLDWEISLVRMGQAMDRAEKPMSGDCRYQVTKPGMKAVLCTRRTGGVERVLVGRLATAEAEDRWKLTEIRPAPGGKAAPSGPPTLLPMPAGTQRSAHRENAGGQVVGEIVSLNVSLSRVQEEWKGRGWEVQDLTPPEGAMRGLACRRDGQVIQVWANIPAEPSGPLFLMLVRVSGRAPLRGE